MNRRTFWMVALGLAALAAPSFSFAQDRQNRGNGQDRGAEFRQRYMDDLKKQLDAKDDEWQVLQPKIEKVSAARIAMMSRGMFGRGGPGGGDRGGRGGDSSSSQASSPVQAASKELSTALENKDTPPDQIQAKLTALRAARTRAKTDLEAAQKDLQAVLTPRQEAVLVTNGLLE
jgi:peptidoglycan hydrolase CwlO-like protein